MTDPLPVIPSINDRANEASMALNVAVQDMETARRTETAELPIDTADHSNEGSSDHFDDVVGRNDTEVESPRTRPVACGISETKDASVTEEETPLSTESTALLRTQSTPTLAPEPLLIPLRRSFSGDTTVYEVNPSEAAQERPSETSSVESDDAVSTASVAPTPSAAPSGTTTKSTSYKMPRRDASLRIFFPTDDLAMKAILSPPALRGLSGRTQSTSQLETKPTLTESFLETTSRLFFLRGNNSTSALSTQTLTEKDSKGSSNEASGSTISRQSTTSVSIKDDLSKLNDTIVAANPNLPPPPFANMYSCENCHEDIGSLLSKGRHHCRNCGGSFCASCSSKTSIVPFQLYLSKGELRVCDGCFNRIREFHAQAQTTQITWSGLMPPSSDVLVREFDLPPHETPLTVFNCSYFVDFAPFYGHLFLTREHICFRGYKTHKIKIAFADLHSLVKPEFYYINALQINTKTGKEKHFFAEFNGLRDLCFLRTDQLVRAFQDAKKKELIQSMSNEQLKQQAMGRRRSYRVLAAAVGHGDLANFMEASKTLDTDDEDDESDLRSNPVYSEDRDEAMSIGSSASDESAEAMPPDALLAKMTTLLDCDLRAETQCVFEWLWGNDHGLVFLRGHMEDTKDIEIEIEEWQPITNENATEVAKGFVISKEDDYTMFRNVRSKHPPKIKFPGLPPYAGCCRLQRVRVEKSVDGTKWTRFVVSDLLRMSGIPFSDYFEIESRWVFTRDGKNYCHVQVGLIVNFIKSTWFKSQIDSSTRSESKEGLELWAKNALVFLQDRAGSVPTRSSIPVDVTPSVATADVSEGIPSRRSSVSSDRSARSARKSQTVIMEPPATPSSSTMTSLDLGGLLAKPQSLVQLLMVLALLYCVVVIRNQQAELQQLTDTTSMLLTKLQHHAGDVSGTTQTTCEQRLVEGAAAAVHNFFESQH